MGAPFPAGRDECPILAIIPLGLRAVPDPVAKLPAAPKLSIVSFRFVCLIVLFFCVYSKFCQLTLPKCVFIFQRVVCIGTKLNVSLSQSLCCA
jgi:hypothetical protein